MLIALSLDRFEGDGKALAVLVADDGTTIHLPRRLLPDGTRPGDVLTLSLERDAEATRKLAEDVRAVQDELRGSDPGGDLRL